ncbi:MAG: type II toxin-antitoxin system VapC family toxin [Candidatus Caldarchaeum sp.]
MSVLDASVILKWFVEEEDSVQALRLREEFYAGEREIVVPDLLLFEVANALRYNPNFTAEAVQESIDTLFAMEIEIITPTASLLAKTITLAKDLDVTCYDAVYLALAEELGFEFITADEKLYRKASEKNRVRVLLKLLADVGKE